MNYKGLLEWSTALPAERQSPPPDGPPTFTNDPLEAAVTTIQALHITELRDAINALRVRAGLTAVGWAESVSSGVTIKATHITEMRTRLEEARTALGLSPTSYTDPGLGAGYTVKAAHIQELRDSLKAAWTTSSQIPRDGQASLTYDVASDRITTAGFAYDAAGNQVRALISSGTSQRFQYDAANRLVKVKADDNTTVRAAYTYGDSNERLMAEEGSLRTYYACNGSAEYIESGGSTAPAWSKSYVYLGGRLLSTLTPNGSGGESVEFHHPDRLGTRLVTNPSTGASFEQVTMPFGTALNAESTGATNRRFTSYDRSDTTKLDYAVNRHYDPQQGRFTQVDPIGMSAASLASPQSFNMYSYCGNDPINHADPSGLFWGKLIRFVNKVIKWLKVAVAVALIVLTIWFAPALTGIVIAKALALAGALLGSALGPRWLQTAITVGFAAVGIYLQGPQIIWNFAQAGAHAADRVLSAIGWLNVVGTVTRYLAQNPHKIGPSGDNNKPGGKVRGKGCPPSGGELANNSEVRKALDEAWTGSLWQAHPDRGFVERGGWIYMDRSGRLSVVIKPMEARDYATGVYLGNPPSKRGKVIVGDFHTHPDAGGDEADIALETARGLPGIWKSGNWVQPYGPERGMWGRSLPKQCQ